MSFPSLHRTYSSANLNLSEPTPLMRNKAIHDPKYFELGNFLCLHDKYPVNVSIALTKLFANVIKVEYETLVEFFEEKNMLDNDLAAKLREMYNQEDKNGSC